MEYSSNINDLPVNPVGGGNNSNVQMSASETTSTPTYNPNINTNTNTNNTNANMNNNEKTGSSPVSLDQTTINQIINGLQQAGSTTQLPSRDIPQNIQNLVQDPQIHPDYIPRPTSMHDYIGEEDNDGIIDSYNKKIHTMNKLDDMYNELQAPMLMAVLFFLFQLPIVKKLLFDYLPFLFFKDGNINLYGYFFTSILFGLLYYILLKIMNYFSTF
jgi:hypothetical protein